MDEVSLSVPKPIVDSLPEEGDAASQDMQQAVAGWEARINRAIDEAADDAEAVSFVVDAVDELSDRVERYDEFVVELRAWGQSPIYAMAWRNLCADVVEQLYAHEDLGEALDRERNARLVEDGIRLRDL